jgi:hypothetical protein
MATRDERGNDQGWRPRRFQEQRPLVDPNVIEVRLSAHFDGSSAQVRWEVEMVEGTELETTSLIFGWVAFNAPYRDWLAEFLEGVAQAKSRVSPF